MNTYNEIDISMVIPVYNEAESLEPLYKLLVEVVSKLEKTYEIIFIDDGSTDRSFEKIEQLHEQDQNIRAIQFRRNFGKSAALSVGFDLALGNVVITLDADLQDDPREIPKLLDKLNSGYDLVSGWKHPRLDPISKTLPSAFFNRVTSLMTGIKIHDFNCGFKAYRGEVVKEINLYGELHRYIPVLADMRGFSVAEVAVKHHPRQFGRSKFGIGRFFKGAFDLLTILFITRYSHRPLHIFGIWGVAILLLGMGINIYLSLIWLFTDAGIGDRPLLILGVLLTLVGLQTIFFGLLGEMIASTKSSADDYPIKKKL